MMKACFVTGTDTGVGKTTVGVALLAAALERGLRVGCMKPAESGCARNLDGTLLAHDAEALLRVTNLGQTIDDVCPYRLEQAVAPGVAAARSGMFIDLDVIEAACTRLRQARPDFALIEGAGGLLVPFSERSMVVDVAIQLELPLLVVARPGLGTINHTLLTLEAAASRGLSVAGFVFSCAERDLDPTFVTSNAEEIARWSALPYLGCLPFVSERAHDELVRCAAPMLDALLARL